MGKIIEDARGVAEAVKAAKAAQEAWGSMSVRARARKLRPILGHIAENAEGIAEAICADMGKTRVDAMAAEILPAALGLSHYLRKGPGILASRKKGISTILLFNKASAIQRVPFGAVAVISPWNYPFSIPFAEICAGLLAGNAVILKAASICPRTAEALDACVAAADLPEGLYARVAMPGREAGDAILEAGVDKVFFTGSTATGRLLMAKAAASLTPIVLELGGCDAAIVRADADLDRAAWGLLWAAYANAGQSCGGTQRILVHESAYAAFKDKFSSRVRALRFGAPGAPDADIGPLAAEKQRIDFEGQMRRASRAGARIVASSEPPEDWQGPYAAAVLMEEDAGTSFPGPEWTEEFFGPMAVMRPYADDDEAIALANASEYGLTSSVWSRNRREARAMASRLKAGAVMINDHLMSHGLAETPWGGFKASGIGRSHGAEGLLEMTQARAVVDERLTIATKNIWWHPYSAKTYRGLKGALDFLHGRGIAKRFRGFISLARIIGRYFEK
jgi:acyl-CoA reductase-like NAD-dependent aldehyde dehydrogenase